MPLSVLLQIATRSIRNCLVQMTSLVCAEIQDMCAFDSNWCDRASTECSVCQRCDSYLPVPSAICRNRPVGGLQMMDTTPEHNFDRRSVKSGRCRWELSTPILLCRQAGRAFARSTCPVPVWQTLRLHARLGITSLADVATTSDAYSACDLPLLVDIELAGELLWVSSERFVAHQSRGGALHLEDQVAEKRCGHRPGKSLVSTEEMCDRISAAVHGRSRFLASHHGSYGAIAAESFQSAIDRTGIRSCGGGDDLR